MEWRLLLVLGAGAIAERDDDCPGAGEDAVLLDALRAEGPAGEDDGVIPLERGFDKGVAGALFGADPDTVRGDPFLGILFTTLPGRRTNDSVPDGLGAVPSRLAPGPEAVLDCEVVRRWGGGVEFAGRSLMSSLSLDRRFAASHAVFAAGDALSLARRCVGVSELDLNESRRVDGPGRLSGLREL